MDIITVYLPKKDILILIRQGKSDYLVLSGQTGVDCVLCLVLTRKNTKLKRKVKVFSINEFFDVKYNSDRDVVKDVLKKIYPKIIPRFEIING